MGTKEKIASKTAVQAECKLLVNGIKNMRANSHCYTAKDVLLFERLGFALKISTSVPAAEVNINYSLWRDLLQSSPSEPNCGASTYSWLRVMHSGAKFTQESPTRSACKRGCTRDLVVGWVHLQRCPDSLYWLRWETRRQKPQLCPEMR